MLERNGFWYEYNNLDGVIEVSNDNGETIGMICANEGDWDKIENGADPIAEGWEDGMGNILSADGWGEYRSEEYCVEDDKLIADIKKVKINPQDKEENER